MAPRSMGPIAVQPNMDDAAKPVFDKIVYGLATKTMALHDTRPIPIHYNVSVAYHQTSSSLGGSSIFPSSNPGEGLRDP